MFGMFKKKVDLSDLSKLDRDDLKELGKTMKGERYGVILRQAAEQGSVDAQILLSSMLAMLMRDKSNLRSLQGLEDEFFKYSKLAAASGDANSQFNLGKLYMSKVDMSDGKLYSDDHDYVRQAEYWMRKAQAQGHPNAVSIVPSLEDIFRMAHMKLDEPIESGFPTISLLNRLISAGAEREFVTAVSAIWFVQAANDPNTPESQQIAGGIIGTLENFFVEEARAIDFDVFNLFTSTINNSEYGALFEESQPIYAAGRKEVNEKFPPGSTQIMEIYSHYANVMLNTTKQNKKDLLDTLQALAPYVDKMCGLANQAEKDLF